MPETQKSGAPHPLQAMRSAPAPLVFAFFLILTLVLMVVLLRVDRPLQTAAAPKGIISFEFAGSVQRAGEIVQSWEGRPAPFAGFSLGIDYLYMVAYATTIAWACIWASRMVETRRWPFATLGILLAWGQIMAAGLDALENVALLILLLVRVAAPWPQVAWIAAALKFALILAGLLYSVLGVGAWLAGRTKQVGLAR
jgi:hypothetical protein